MGDTMDTTPEENDRHGYSQPTRAQFDAVRAVLGYREAELLALKGPCSNKACSLHRAHSGPCAEVSPAPVAELSPDSGTGQPSDLESRWRQAFSEEWRRRGGPTPLVELDAAMYGTAFEWHKPDGSVVRIPPAEMRVIVK